jgi:AcrR family transcriptional regulator
VVAITESNGRTNQKARTRQAIVDACVELIRQRQPVTMPEVARAAMVSEATAYRYFPDLATLLAAALSEDWPRPADALAPVEASTDPVERVAFATRFLLQGVAERQEVVRSMIAATIGQPGLSSRARPGLRFGLIEHALAPFVDALASPGPERLAQLRLDLAVVMSAEALFSLTDLCGLSIGEAIESAVTTARTVTAAAFRSPATSSDLGQPSRH